MLLLNTDVLRKLALLYLVPGPSTDIHFAWLAIPLRTECSQSRVRMQTWCVRFKLCGVALIAAVITDLLLIRPQACLSIEIASG
ncbi:hypothetical protein BDW66DRAFT_123968 [Aspergillus desertorum]